MNKEIKSADLLNGKDVNIENLMDEIESFDKYHNMGSMLARYIIQLGKDEKNTVFEADKSTDHTQTIVTKYGDVLNEIGLSFETANSQMKAFHQDGEAEAKKLNFNIADAGKFAGYLEKVSQKLMSKKEKKFVAKTLTSLIEQFERNYDYDSAQGDDNFLNAAGGLKKVSQGFLAIAENQDETIKNPAKKLAEFEKRLSKGYFKEYIFASKHNLTDDIKEWSNYFSPLSWHSDCTCEMYRNKWNNICFQALDNFKKNPNAQAEYQELLAKLNQAMEFAKKDIDQRIAKVNIVNCILLYNAIKQEMGPIAQKLAEYK